MAKPEWGLKRVCPNCGVRYYDLHRDPVTCPKCGSPFDPEALLKTRRTRAAATPDPDVIDAAGEDEVETEGEDAETSDAEETEEEEEELIEDASELGEDEDDVAEVIEGVEDEEER